MSRTQALMVAAIMFDAMVAGIGLDRVVVQRPAWTRLGPQAWAAFSRQADLGNGLILYPTLAIGGCALSIAAALSCGRDGRGTQGRPLPAYVAVVLTLCGLLLTIKAAPLMLSLRSLGSDSRAIRAPCRACSTDLTAGDAGGAQSSAARSERTSGRWLCSDGTADDNRSRGGRLASSFEVIGSQIPDACADRDWLATWY